MEDQNERENYYQISQYIFIRVTNYAFASLYYTVAVCWNGGTLKSGPREMMYKNGGYASCSISLQGGRIASAAPMAVCANIQVPL